MRKFIMVTLLAVLVSGVFVLCVFCKPGTATGADITTIEVSNAREFLEALGSDRIIDMDYTGDYNLSKWDPYLLNRTDMPKLAEGVSWSEAFDGGELILRGIKNLTIRGEGAEGSRAEIVIDPRYAFVMKFENCSDIVMEGLSAGHSGESGCLGGVFSFTDSSRITINNTRMYGCGTEGLALSNVYGMKVTDSGIYDCTYYIMTVTGGENIVFEDCMFMHNQEFTLVNVSETRNMSFTNCHFNENRGQMFKVEGTTISVSNSSFNRNKTGFSIQDSANVKFTDCEFRLSEAALDDDVFLELCETGKPQEVENAIEAGANINARGPMGVTALMSAAWNNSDPGVITALLKAGSDVNARISNGRTALMGAAAYNSNPEVITALIQAGANANAADNNGWTPLMDAARLNSNPEIITVLLKAGSNANARDNDGKCAIDYAFENESIKGTKAFKELSDATK